jgi:hypothetical protein
MLWTERLFQLIPIGKESGSFASFLKVRLTRALCLTFVIFLISIPAWLLMGTSTTAHINDMLPLTGLLFILVMISVVFVVSGWFQIKWDWFFGWSSHILRLSETEFNKFRDGREKLVKSSSACLIVTLVLYVASVIPFLELMNKEYGQLMLRPTVFLGYLAFTNFFIALLIGTLLWIIISMWITFSTTLSKPLNLKLSPRTDKEFRPLAIWSLKILLLTFVLVAIVVVFVNLGVIIIPGGFASYLGTLIFLVLMGILAFLLPFYHVHRVLKKLKEQELLEIEEEHDRIIQDLTSMQASDTDARVRSLVSLEILHVRERRAKDADDWPIDTTILSAMAGLVLIPIIVNIITNFM